MTREWLARGLFELRYEHWGSSLGSSIAPAGARLVAHGLVHAAHGVLAQGFIRVFVMMMHGVAVAVAVRNAFVPATARAA